VTYQKKLARRARRLHEVRGSSQVKLVSLVKMVRPQLNSIEWAKQYVHLITLVRIGKALKVPVEKLLK